MARRFPLLLAGIVLGLVTIAGQSAKPSITNGEWPDYSGDLRGWRYSPLDQINASNFGQLRVAWRFKIAVQRLELAEIVEDAAVRVRVRCVRQGP